MSNDRERGKSNHKTKRVFLVVYEGSNKTEKTYFENFKSREADFRLVVAPGNETDPVNLVNRILKYIKQNGLDLDDDDKAFCVFDTDIKVEKNKEIGKAIKLAKKNKIMPIISSPCIEVWFLLHYKYTTASLTNDEVIKSLKEFYPSYEKNCNIYKYIKDKTNVALKNAKRLEKYQLENGKKLQCVETNPYTEVYKLIEILSGECH